MGFAACSSEDVPQPQVNGEGTGNGTYVQLSFTMPTSESRAATEYDADSAESSEKYVVGKDIEYNINKVYLYFFDTDNKIVKVTNPNVAGATEQTYLELGAFMDPNATSTSTLEQNATTSEGLAKVYTTAVTQLPKELAAGTTYRVYALCNRNIAAPDNVVTAEDLLDTTIDYSKADATTDNGNIPMSARSYDGTIYQELTATAANTKNNPYLLTYEIERSYARITFLNTSFEFPLYKTTTDQSEANKLGSVEVMSYQIVNRSKTLYTYRHVGDITEGTYAVTLPPYDWTATDPSKQARFGRMTNTYPYVVDPYSDKKTTDISASTSYFTDLLANAASSDSDWTRISAAESETEPTSIEYVAENCMQTAAQKKGQSTGILFKVRFRGITVEDNSEWREGSDDVYYYDGKFYSDVTATKIPGITTKNFTEYGVRYFKGGVGYYEYYIRHLNNGDDTQMGKMEFAIVRNNSYDLKVKAIAMSPFSNLPGDPKPTDPDDPYDPDKPDSEENDEGAKMYVQVDLNVRPWIVRTNNMTLGH
jgi:hypothetical protein